MFGLTKREQRWKAEQKACELLVTLVVSVTRETRLAREAEHDAEVEKLRAEVARLKAAQLQGPTT